MATAVAPEQLTVQPRWSMGGSSEILEYSLLTYEHGLSLFISFDRPPRSPVPTAVKSEILTALHAKRGQDPPANFGMVFASSDF